MTAYLLLNHLLNFVAPAAMVALLLVVATRLMPGFLGAKRSVVPSMRSQLAVTFLTGLVILVAGLLVFGRDGKLLTYAALAGGAALSQWLLLRGWKR